LNEAGITTIVVTNEQGIALGRMSEHDLEEIYSELAARLEAAARARFVAFFYCQQGLGGCGRSKPETGMFRKALERFPSIDTPRSVVIGDGESSAEAGSALGVRTVRLGADATDLREAVDQLFASGQRALIALER
jgi:HAD superfamily hydrolase (TIGR01662 family)